jgi:hypothetical protein
MLRPAAGADSRREFRQRRNGASDAHRRNRSRRCSRVRVLLASKQDRSLSHRRGSSSAWRVTDSHAHVRERASCRPTRRFIRLAPRPSPAVSHSYRPPRTMAVSPTVNVVAAGSCSPAIPISSPARSPTGGSAPRVDQRSSATHTQPVRTNDESAAQSPTTHLVGHPRIVRPATRTGHRHRRQLCELRTPNQRLDPRHVDVGDSARRRTTVRPTDAALCDLQT